MFKKSLPIMTLCIMACHAHANDSTGYVATGGVQYIKNDNIAMHREDLYISKSIIKVDYQFKNLSKKDITQTVLFPLPTVSANGYDGDFVDITRLPSSFKIWSNSKAVKPTVHTRVYMSPIGTNREKPVDVTAEFRACGISERELQYPWIKGVDFEHIAQKLWDCDNAKLATMIDKSPLDKDDGLRTRIAWDTQLIYSWQQKFAAGAVTRIKHSYQPLVGSGVYFSQNEYDAYCVTDDVKRTLARQQDAQKSISPKFVSYILTTGANWAKPIAHFKLTIKRDRDELVGFCWTGKGRVVKQGGVFTITEKNFIPSKDFDAVFIRLD